MSDLAKMTFDEDQKTNQNFTISVGDVEYQKESLVIVASLGTTKEYLGVEMSLEKIHKLSDKEVEKYFNRYQKVAGQKMANGLVDSAIKTATKVISCFLPIDDTEELCSDLQKDELQSQPKVSGHPQKKALPRFPSFNVATMMSTFLSIFF